MKPMKFWLAAVLLIALTAMAGVSLAAKKEEAKIDPKARTQGMAEAPAAAQAAGVKCQIADARFIGVSEDKKAKTSTSLYEVDCDKGSGYILAATKGGSTMAMGCVETTDPDGKPTNLGCMLPGNSPKSDLAELMSVSGHPCTPESYRFIGRDNQSNKVYLEVLCPANEGYVLGLDAPEDVSKPAAMVANCLAYDDQETALTCKLGDKAARMAVIDKYAAAANNGCQVKGRRFVGAATDGASYFEASCQDGKGYMYKIDSKGAQTTIECAKAQGLLGGCTLTDARQAETEQAALYTKLSTAAGYPCDVAKYGVFPSQGSEDIVELVCKDGKGGVGIFAAGGKGTVYDCGHALVAGYRCSLNKMETGYAGLTDDLRKFNQKSCTVSNSRLVGKTAKGTILVEVGCSDGLKGYMIEYSTNPVNAVAATGCAFAAGCKLPGNT